MEQAIDTSVYFTYQKPELMAIYHEVQTLGVEANSKLVYK